MVGGRGVVLEEAAPFHEAPLRAAEPAEVGAYLDRTAPRRARLEIGRLAFAPEVPARLDAGGFGQVWREQYVAVLSRAWFRWSC